MAYIITITPPYDSEAATHAKRIGQTDIAVSSMDDREIKRRLFNWREGDALSDREQRILDVLKGSAFNPIFDGTTVKLEHWGAARAVNWMVEHGYDPQTESFIETYNEETT